MRELRETKQTTQTKTLMEDRVLRFNGPPICLGLVLTICIWFIAAGAGAQTLYTLNTANGAKGLFAVNQKTGAATLSTTLLPERSWQGLSGRGGDWDGLYAVSSVPGEFGPERFCFSRIDVQTGVLSDLFDLTAAEFGFPEEPGKVFAVSPSAVAIPPMDGSRVVLAVSVIEWIPDVSVESHPVLVSVDFVSGAMIGPVHATAEQITALSYTLDGSTLFAVLQKQGVGAHLATVDPASGAISEIGPMDPTIATGLVFRSTDGALLAADAYYTDALIEVEATSGATTKVVGSFGIIGPEGLAFYPTAGARVPTLSPWALAGL